MQAKVETIIKTLEAKYKSSSEKAPEYMHSSSGSIKYKLHPFSEKSFKEYSPFGADEHFRVAAFDAGSLLVYETPSWNIAYVKLAFRCFEVNLKNRTCNTIQKDRVLEHDMVMLTESGAAGQSESGAAMLLKNDFESGSILKTMETNFILKQIQNGKVLSDDLLLIDGALGRESGRILDKHENVIGVSKRTGHCINNYSAASYMSLKANEHGFKDKSWFYYPLVQEYPGNSVSELIFGTFRGNSNVFRLDFPHKQLHSSENEVNFVKQRMHKLGICALDSKYKAYPYPLGAVHSDAVMRVNTKDLMKQYIKKHLSKAKKKGAEDVFKMLEKDIQHADWYDQLRKGS
jgi:hypothetical protein